MMRPVIVPPEAVGAAGSATVQSEKLLTPSIAAVFVAGLTQGVPETGQVTAFLNIPVCAARAYGAHPVTGSQEGCCVRVSPKLIASFFRSNTQIKVEDLPPTSGLSARGVTRTLGA